jgi:uncharacterized membrane protein YhaH (DUF805 family)
MAKLFSFRGRIGRQTYWLAQITLIGVSLAIPLGVLGIWGACASSWSLSPSWEWGYTSKSCDRFFGDELLLGETMAELLGWLALIVYGCLLVVSFSFTVRRLHDRGLSGWWVLLTLVPVVGYIWLLVECGMLSGTPGFNRHGPYPGRPHGVHVMMVQTAPQAQDATPSLAGYRYS